MNVLLFAPAVFAIIFINTGARETISLLLTAGIIQVEFVVNLGIIITFLDLCGTRIYHI